MNYICVKDCHKSGGESCVAMDDGWDGAGGVGAGLHWAMLKGFEPVLSLMERGGACGKTPSTVGGARGSGGVAEGARDVEHAARGQPIRSSSRKESGTRGRSRAYVPRCRFGYDR